MRETGSNLARNFTLTFAAIITVAVSLTMVAASFLIGQGINNSFLGLRSEQRLFVYMNPTATEDQIDAVATGPGRLAARSTRSTSTTASAPSRSSRRCSATSPTWSTRSSPRTCPPASG